MECLSYCIADNIDLTRLDHHFKTGLSGYLSLRTRDVLKLTPIDSSLFTLFVFKNGTIVSWGIKRHTIEIYINIIKPFLEKPVHIHVKDEVSYRIGTKTTIKPHGFFDIDCLSIDEDNDELKLSLSYGFAQSVKLQYFEMILETLIEKNTPVIQSISRTGAMPVTRNQIRQITGEILGAKSEMNLISNFMYPPKYFWQHPSLEEHYLMLERYLHIQRRVNTINHRLDTLNEIFAMFNGYLENSHSHHLEIIIIVLIAIEIIFAVLNIHF